MGEHQSWNDLEFEKTNRLSKNPCSSFGLLKHKEKRIFIRPSAGASRDRKTWRSNAAIACGSVVSLSTAFGKEVLKFRDR